MEILDIIMVVFIALVVIVSAYGFYKEATKKEED